MSCSQLESKSKKEAPKTKTSRLTAKRMGGFSSGRLHSVRTIINTGCSHVEIILHQWAYNGVKGKIKMKSISEPDH